MTEATTEPGPRPASEVIATTSTQHPPLSNLGGGEVGLIEADESTNTGNDADSAVGSDTQSSTASISSSILKYREENGRTYHAYKDGKYVLPNDDREQERLDLQHHLTLLTHDNRLHLCPAGLDGHTINHVLDIGTGTGIWAIDFADEHPESQVIGVDLSPIQSVFVPANLTFQVDDIEEPWTFTQKFDMIYSRHMTCSINFQRMIEQSYQNLNPGGWLEITDILPVTSDDGTMKGTEMERFMDLYVDGSNKINRPFETPNNYVSWAKEAGFVNIIRSLHKWPTNQWPKDRRLKEIGLWTLENIEPGLEGLSSALFTRVLGWTVPELNALLASVRRDMRNTSIHAHWPLVTMYCQKPLAS